MYAFFQMLLIMTQNNSKIKKFKFWKTLFFRTLIYITTFFRSIKVNQTSYIFNDFSVKIALMPMSEFFINIFFNQFYSILTVFIVEIVVFFFGWLSNAIQVRSLFLQTKQIIFISHGHNTKWEKKFSILTSTLKLNRI